MPTRRAERAAALEAVRRLQFANGSNGKIALQDVAEVLRGDVCGDGETHQIDIITALTEYALSNQNATGSSQKVVPYFP